ncbi:MAG: sensor histidine kinase [Alkalispirochaeta sp.]
MSTMHNVLDTTGTNVDRATALRLVPWIEELYRQRGDWNDIDRALRGLSIEAPPRARRSPMMMENRGAMMRPGDRAAAPFFERNVAIVNESGQLLAATPSTEAPQNFDVDQGVRISLDEEQEAWVFVGSMISAQDNPIRQAILTSFLRAGTAAALIILLGATAVSTLWARWLLHPIRSIEAASRAMEDGNYAVTVPEPAGDHELRTLARSFNAMVAEVAQQEQTRRRFVADAAHEVRTPVSLLSGRIELLRAGVYDTTPEQWHALQQSVGRIASLVADLQTIAHLDAGRVVIQPQQLDPVQILRDVADEFAPAAQAESITLSVEVPEGLPQPPRTVTADPTKLHQVLVNLLSNALRHTPAGGAVVLSAGGSHPGPDPATATATATPQTSPTAPNQGLYTPHWPHSLHPRYPSHSPHPPTSSSSPESGGVILAVEDSGPGIPPSERERIFERFTRLDEGRNRDHGGSGLGLSITRRLVELHGGTIQAVEPKGVGGGARFEVELF